MPDFFIHSVLSYHFESNLCGALEIVGRACRHVTRKHEVFRCTAAHEDSYSIFKITFGKQEFDLPLAAESYIPATDAREMIEIF